MKNAPKHILDADQFEPLYIHQENILEDTLGREAERVAHQENLMNRVVYDSMTQQEDPAPSKAQAEAPVSQPDDNPLNLPTTTNCDNDATFENFYKP